MSKFKKGDRVMCIGGDVKIECIVEEVMMDPYGLRYVKVLDLLSGRYAAVSENEIDFDVAYYRNKSLSLLGI